MPTFKIKDLMINLPTGTDICIAHTTQTFCRIACQSGLSGCFLHTTQTCGGCSIQFSCFTHSCGFTNCGFVSNTCGFSHGCGGTINCGGSIDPTFVNQGGVIPTTHDEINILREQLKQQMVALDEHEKALNEQLQPSTLEEADALEKSLTEALAEVKVQKEKLKKQKK